MAARFFRWLAAKRMAFDWSWEISWPDASKDKCKICGVVRKEHKSMAHAFSEVNQ